MQAIHLILEGDGAWPELDDGRVVQHLGTGTTIAIAALQRGTRSGQPSVAFRFDLPDGSVVLAETTLRLFLATGDALRVRYPDVAALS